MVWIEIYTLKEKATIYKNGFEEFISETLIADTIVVWGCNSQHLAAATTTVANGDSARVIAPNPTTATLFRYSTHLTT